MFLHEYVHLKKYIPLYTGVAIPGIKSKIHDHVHSTHLYTVIREIIRVKIFLCYQKHTIVNTKVMAIAMHTNILARKFPPELRKLSFHNAYTNKAYIALSVLDTKNTFERCTQFSFYYVCGY